MIKYCDVPFFISKNEFTNDINLIKGANALRSAIKNITYIIPGERPFNPKLGSRIFIDSENVDQSSLLELTSFIDEIYRSIYFNDNRIENLNIRIINDRSTLLVEFKDKNNETTYNFTTTIGDNT